MICFIFILYFCVNDMARVVGVCSEHKNQFSYKDGPTGPDNWPNLFPKCGGQKQSPVDIEMSQLENLKVEPLQWSAAYFSVPLNMSLKNNGHTLMLETYYKEDCRPRITGGPLSTSYTLDNIHFHWGTTDSKGSEHTIDNFAYPLEMHAVHRRSGSSSRRGNKIMVVAYFFQVAGKGIAPINRITNVIHKTVKHPEKAIKLKRYFDIASLVQPFSFEYATYKGSLTTPPCTETVRWIVYPYPLDISKKQLQKFREAADLKNNFRPTQPINDRVIFFVS